MKAKRYTKPLKCTQRKRHRPRNKRHSSTKQIQPFKKSDWEQHLMIIVFYRYIEHNLEATSSRRRVCFPPVHRCYRLGGTTEGIRLVLQQRPCKPVARHPCAS
eukprot:4684913-Amphidinium_carterae.1